MIFDGGIRRGTDVFKALALGAQAVMVIFELMMMMMLLNVDMEFFADRASSCIWVSSKGGVWSKKSD